MAGQCGFTAGPGEGGVVVAPAGPRATVASQRSLAAARWAERHDVGAVAGSRPRPRLGELARNGSPPPTSTSRWLARHVAHRRRGTGPSGRAPRARRCEVSSLIVEAGVTVGAPERNSGCPVREVGDQDADVPAEHPLAQHRLDDRGHRVAGSPGHDPGGCATAGAGPVRRQLEALGGLRRRRARWPGRPCPSRTSARRGRTGSSAPRRRARTRTTISARNRQRRSVTSQWRCSRTVASGPLPMCRSGESAGETSPVRRRNGARCRSSPACAWRKV